MASRFFMRNSDSDTESDTESEIASQISDVKSEIDLKHNPYLQTDSEEEEDEKDARDIVPKRLKRYEQMLGIINQMKNPININDWVSLQESFDKLNQQLDKVLQVRRSKKVPSLYIRALVMLEDSLVKALGNKELRKKMSSSNAKALNIMKQRVKKHNKVYEDLIRRCREDRESKVDEETDEDEDSEYTDDEVTDIVPDVGANKDVPKETSEITWDTVDKKLKAIVAARGKKGTGRVEQVEQLTFLRKSAMTPAQELEILLNLVSAQFNVNPSRMPTNIWKDCVRNALNVVEMLRQYRNIVVVDESVETEEGETRNGADYKETIRVKGNLVAFLEGLGVEFYKSLRLIDSHSLEYVERLRDEVMLFSIAQNVQDYLQSVGDFAGAAKAALKQMELLYYKPLEVYDSMRKMVENADDLVLRKPTFPEECRELMDALVSLIYKYGDEMTKARAVLCDVYHHAIADHFSVSCDLMLMSHLQDEVQKLDVSTQMLFNRAMAQLGMCAFRCGLISEAHNCLSELCSTGSKVKDLLGQGFSHNRYNIKNSEEEKQEQMPYHMHINLALLESVHLTCAMILEVPNMAAITHDPKRKVISKTFRRLFEFNKKQIFTGPPETTRDHIITATTALKTGDYQKAFNVIKSINAWKSLNDHVNILEMVETKIKEAALKTYLFTYSSSYERLSLDSLITMFGLSESHTQSILNKMIFSEEIHASWDMSSRCLVFHTAEYTRLQILALQFINKISSVAENNEKGHESKHTTWREYHGITA